MTKKIIFGIIVCVLIIGGVVYWNYFRGIGPAILPPPGDIADLLENANSNAHVSSAGNTNEAPKPAQNSTDFPLKLPDGFLVSILAKNLNKPRVMRFDSFGNMWVSEIGAGAVTKIGIEGGVAQRQERVYTGLKRPHGLAFDPIDFYVLYIAEEDKISRVNVALKDTLHKIADLPAGGRHFSRTIGFGPDGRLYVSIGSSCDVCNEEDERRAAIYSMNRDGSDFKLFAKGLRNTVFFTWSDDGKMWGTDMGRDRLGDNLPPDEVNIIGNPSTSSGQEPRVPDYGWPICYGKNIHDTAFDKNRYIRNPCMEPFEIPSHIDLPAHIAPLGLAFIPKDSKWPKEYWGDLLIAYHGSWNSTKPVGYKVVRVKLDEAGRHEGTEDFISGWLTSKGALGRPVDLLALPDGTLYISDDHAGVIYQVKFQ